MVINIACGIVLAVIILAVAVIVIGVISMAFVSAFKKHRIETMKRYDFEEEEDDY